MDKTAPLVPNTRADNCSEPMDNYVMNHKCTTNTLGGTPGLSHNKTNRLDLKQAMQTTPRSLIKLPSVDRVYAGLRRQRLGPEDHLC